MLSVGPTLPLMYQPSRPHPRRSTPLVPWEKESVAVAYRLRRALRRRHQNSSHRLPAAESSLGPVSAAPSRPELAAG